MAAANASLGDLRIWTHHVCYPRSICAYNNTPATSAQRIPHLIWGFRRVVEESCDLLGYYTASSANSLPTFRDNLSVPSSRVKNPRNYHHSLRNNPEEGSYRSPFPTGRAVNPSETSLYLPYHHFFVFSDTIYYKTYIGCLRFCKAVFWPASDATTLRFLTRS